MISVRIAKATDVGRKRNLNEDAVAFRVPSDDGTLGEKGILCAVADGMGGHEAGEEASNSAVKNLIPFYYNQPPGKTEDRLRQSVEETNRTLFETASKRKGKGSMGTTLVGAVLVQNRLYVANVGDSRAYLFSEGEADRITEDHSWVQEQVAAGYLSEESLYTHPRRNLITRALGLHANIEVDLFERTIRSGDRILLCSDGLWGTVDEEKISTTVRNHSPDEAAQFLVDLANQNGGPDNITVLICEVLEMTAP